MEWAGKMRKILGVLIIASCLISQVCAKDYPVDRVLTTDNMEDSLNDVAFSEKSDQVTAGGNGRVVHVWNLSKDTYVVSLPPSRTIGKVSKNDNDPILRVVFSADNLYVVALYERFGPNAFIPMLPDRPLIPRVGNKTGSSALWYDMMNEKTYVSNIAEIYNGSVGTVTTGWNVMGRKLQTYQYGGAGMALNNNGKIRTYNKSLKTKVLEEKDFHRIIAAPAWFAVTKKESELKIENNLKVIDRKTGEIIWEKTIPQSASNNLAMTEGEKFLLVGTPGAIIIFDSETGEEKGRLISSDYQTGRIRFSPDNKWLAAAGEGKVLLWEWGRINAELN